MSNNTHTLYVGATNDLPARVREHKTRIYRTSFTARYTFDRCVYYELLGAQADAIKREQQVKRWSRSKKIALIESMNPWWDDLSARLRLEKILR